MPGGRPKTPTAQLKLHGSLDRNKTRYADRANEPQPIGVPQPPEDLSEWGQYHWQKVVPELVRMGVAKEVDEMALASMCEWWAEYKRLQNGEAGEEGHKRYIQMCMCHKQWRDLASRFGLTPSDRANLTVDNGQASDPAAEFIA